MYNILARKTPKFVKRRGSPKTKRMIRNGARGGKRVVLLKRRGTICPRADPSTIQNARKGSREHRRCSRPSPKPGTICMLLAGPQKGQRVVVLKRLKSGLLLVSGPFVIDACPVRKVNKHSLVATPASIDLSSLKLQWLIHKERAEGKNSNSDNKEDSPPSNFGDAYRNALHDSSNGHASQNISPANADTDASHAALHDEPVEHPRDVASRHNSIPDVSQTELPEPDDESHAGVSHFREDSANPAEDEYSNNQLRVAAGNEVQDISSHQKNDDAISSIPDSRIDRENAPVSRSRENNHTESNERRISSDRLPLPGTEENNQDRLLQWLYHIQRDEHASPDRNRGDDLRNCWTSDGLLENASTVSSSHIGSTIGDPKSARSNGGLLENVNAFSSSHIGNNVGDAKNVWSNAYRAWPRSPEGNRVPVRNPWNAWPMLLRPNDAQNNGESSLPNWYRANYARDAWTSEREPLDDRSVHYLDDVHGLLEDSFEASNENGAVDALSNSKRESDENVTPSCDLRLKDLRRRFEATGSPFDQRYSVRSGYYDAWSLALPSREGEHEDHCSSIDRRQGKNDRSGFSSNDSPYDVWSFAVPSRNEQDDNRIDRGSSDNRDQGYNSSFNNRNQGNNSSFNNRGQEENSSSNNRNQEENSSTNNRDEEDTKEASAGEKLLHPPQRIVREPIWKRYLREQASQPPAFEDTLPSFLRLCRAQHREDQRREERLRSQPNMNGSISPDPLDEEYVEMMAEMRDDEDDFLDLLDYDSADEERESVTGFPNYRRRRAGYLAASVYLREDGQYGFRNVPLPHADYLRPNTAQLRALLERLLRDPVTTDPEDRHLATVLQNQRENLRRGRAERAGRIEGTGSAPRAERGDRKRQSTIDGLLESLTRRRPGRRGYDELADDDPWLAEELARRFASAATSGVIPFTRERRRRHAYNVLNNAARVADLNMVHRIADGRNFIVDELPRCLGNVAAASKRNCDDVPEEEAWCHGWGPEAVDLRRRDSSDSIYENVDCEETLSETFEPVATPGDRSRLTSASDCVI